MTPDQIRSLRGSLHLTQAAFGERVGVTSDAVRSWERGRRHPNASAALRLAALGNGDSTVESKGIPNAPGGTGRAIIGSEGAKVGGDGDRNSGAIVENRDQASAFHVDLDDVQRERDTVTAERDNLRARADNLALALREVVTGMVPALAGLLDRYLAGEDVRYSAKYLRETLDRWTSTRGELVRG
jgi:transcriptional regulator with XRE-family HTH domain